MRVTTDAAAPTTGQLLTKKKASTPKLFFGTDDNVATLKKTDHDDEEEASKKDIEAVLPPQKEEDVVDKEIYDLARDTFHVYFTLDDSNEDTSKINQRRKKKSRIYKKINGTMPSLPSYLRKLPLPEIIVNVILFTEASFRGIAQVSVALSFCWKYYRLHYMFS